MLWPLTHAKFYGVALALKKLGTPGLRAQIVLRGMVALRYQHHQPFIAGGVDNKVPQLHATHSEPLDYYSVCF